MLPVEKISPLFYDAERARDDSCALWREVVARNSNWRFDVPPPQAFDKIEKLSLNLAARYQVGDGNEFAGEIREIGPCGILLKGQKEGRLGNWCTANIASVGIVEGLVVQAGRETFTVGIIALPTRIHRLAWRFHWQLRRGAAALKDRRSSQRVELNHASASLKTADGRISSCEIFDISDGGAAVHLGAKALYFWVDQPIWLDGRPGVVLRTFPGGMVIKFDRDAEDFDDPLFDDPIPARAGAPV